MDAVFCGTFDPVTIGHMDIIERAAALFDHLTVIVTPNSGKKTMFNDTFRQQLLKACCRHLPNVDIEIAAGLATQACRARGARILIRSLRSAADCDYEQNMAAVNALIDPAIETMFLFGKPEHTYISSSNVRELLRYGLDISSLVPPAAAKLIKEETDHEHIC